MGAILTKLLEVFWTKKLDIVVIGLENRCVRFCFCGREDGPSFAVLLARGIYVCIFLCICYVYLCGIYLSFSVCTFWTGLIPFLTQNSSFFPVGILRQYIL